MTRAGSDACRPEDLGEEFGFRDGAYLLSEQQAQGILDMQLQRLTALQRDRLMDDYGKILDEIRDLTEILGSRERLESVIRDELTEIRDRYGDERRTEIQSSHQDLSAEDLITEEDMVVTVSHQGYAKTQPLDVYQAQRRGGRGKAATSVKDEDFVEHVLTANSHDMLLCFSNRGKVYWLRVFQIPQGSRGAKGRPLVNMLQLDSDERITTLLPMKKHAQQEGVSRDAFVFMATANGTVKKTPLQRFARPRSLGLIAIDLSEGDHLVGVALTDGYSGHTARRQFRQGGALQGIRRTRPEPHRPRRARHPSRQGPLRHLAHHPGRRFRADRKPERLRQAHPTRGVPREGTRSDGRDRDAGRPTQRPAGRRGAGVRGRRDRAHQRPGHAGPDQRRTKSPSWVATRRA